MMVVVITVVAMTIHFEIEVNLYKVKGQIHLNYSIIDYYCCYCCFHHCVAKPLNVKRKSCYLLKADCFHCFRFDVLFKTIVRDSAFVKCLLSLFGCLEDVNYCC